MLLEKVFNLSLPSVVIKNTYKTYIIQYTIVILQNINSLIIIMNIYISNHIQTIIKIIHRRNGILKICLFKLLLFKQVSEQFSQLLKIFMFGLKKVLIYMFNYFHMIFEFKNFINKYVHQTVNIDTNFKNKLNQILIILNFDCF